MATVLETQMYPPIVQTYMPAFTITGTTENSTNGKNVCRIYFAESPYNALEPTYVQISVKGQRSNENVIKLPAGIKIVRPKIDSTVNTEYFHYVELNKNDVDFEINQYYKVQLRCVSTTEIVPGDTGSSESPNATNMFKWVTNNEKYFSEWSTVTLIKPISQPHFEMTSLSTLKSTTLQITGRLKFDNPKESDTLRSYQLKLCTANNTVIEESPIINTSLFNNVNEINYLFKKELTNNTQYKVVLDYTTYNLYHSTETTSITVNVPATTTDSFAEDITFLVEECSNQGAIKIRTSRPITTGEVDKKHIMFRRTSSRSNFKEWEDIYFINYVNNDYLNATPLTVEMAQVNSPEDSYYKNYYGVYINEGSSIKMFEGWYDNSVESGVWYKYGAQLINSNGERGPLKIAINAATYEKQNPSVMAHPPKSSTQNPTSAETGIIDNQSVMVLFDNIFINAEDEQLKIKYDASISSFKHNIVESKTDTIGSRFPYIKRNAAVNYKQFSISGTITAAINDENEYIYDEKTRSFQRDYSGYNFLTREQLYSNAEIANMYEEYNLHKGIEYYQDIVYEREFREKVIDFLYKDNVKLIRTGSEKPIIAKLMNINLTPETSRGNLYYKFTAEAYEIDEYNLANIYKYDIIADPSGTISPSMRGGLLNG